MLLQTCAVWEAPRLRRYVVDQLDLAGGIQQKTHLEFHHRSPLIREILTLGEMQVDLETTQATAELVE